MFQIEPFGDCGIRVQLGNSISREINAKVRSLSWFLEKENIRGVLEWIPTYAAVSIYYEPYVITFEELKKQVESLEERLEKITLPPAYVIKIPVIYGGDAGPDLEHVATHNGLNMDEVIHIHTSSDYLIYMMGFTPGFPYLGGMSEKVATPRLKEPRLKIPVGSVGIAGSQTGVYPMETPGGWQIIGRTPVKLYEPMRNKPILLKAGNYIRFVQVTESEYKEIERQVEDNSYEVETVLYEGE
ncbi:5-oxoprolinase subunit PxpB [Oceanobacillus sp. Castelsardo]|uniref:5-oxoprolinase subunit PxpB n=1 Tax=Oceanobacillus sp. Castelsardo TaxID=1851204 RepID=UPI000838EA26|nr:5-oxoprolinase subunit PxpB [Oceanobacillus sp. Castelsardo]